MCVRWVGGFVSGFVLIFVVGMVWLFGLFVCGLGGRFCLGGFGFCLCWWLMYLTRLRIVITLIGFY